MPRYIFYIHTLNISLPKAQLLSFKVLTFSDSPFPHSFVFALFTSVSNILICFIKIFKGFFFFTFLAYSHFYSLLQNCKEVNMLGGESWNRTMSNRFGICCATITLIAHKQKEGRYSFCFISSVIKIWCESFFSLLDSAKDVRRPTENLRLLIQLYLVDFVNKPFFRVVNVIKNFV